MSESLEELKSVIDNAPSCGTAIEVCFYDYGEDMTLDYLNCENQFYDPEEGRWVDKLLVDNYFHSYRSIKDIKRIIELMELNQNMHTTVAGYIYGKDWEHWNEFNAGRFRL